MPLPADDGAHSALVVPACDHDQLAHIELDEVLDLPGLNVKHDCVIDLRRQAAPEDGCSHVGIDTRQGLQAGIDGMLCKASSASRCGVGAIP